MVTERPRQAARAAPAAARGRARPGAGVSAKGAERVGKILSSALDVLIGEGYHGFTMRAVAEHCGITVGNLTYYYPTKNDLLRALLAHVQQSYAETFQDVLAGAPETPLDQLEALVRYVFSDLATRETTGLFLELWAMANHERYAAQIMDDIYSWERDVFADIIAALRPDLTRTAVQRLALFVSATIEGHTMFVGHRKSQARHRRESENIVVTAVLATVREVTQAQIEA